MMRLAVEPDLGRWLKTYRGLYGAAATPALRAQQQRFAEVHTGNVETDGALYERTIGREARHALGEYFTPGWLADFVLDRLGYTGRGTLLDPSAGLGVFLHRAKERGGEAVTGYELNPLTAAVPRSNGLAVEVRDTLCDTGERRFDFVAGNPPWVNWRYLNAAYRQRIAPLWQHYGLLPRTGLTARLGAGMDDLSILFTYVCADRLLAEGGRMGLLLSKTLFQSAGGGRTFRRFELPGGRYLNVLSVDEVEGGPAFAGAMNETVAVRFEVTGAPTVYPVAWFRGGERWEARPVTDDQVSPWAVLRPGAAALFDKMRGASTYRARVGIHTGGATGVYWVDVVERRGASVVIRNRNLAGRAPWPAVTAEIEPDLVRMLARGRDLSCWRVRPSATIVLPHSSDGRPVAEAEMRERWPLTFAYFEQFRDRMLERPHYLAHFARLRLPYWSMYNVGPYTFAPHRVVWREQASRFECAVLEDGAWVADAKLVVVACESAVEAHYVAAMLNSTAAREFVASYSLRVQMSTHVLRHLRVPRFDAGDERHVELAAVGAECARVGAADERLDTVAREIWAAPEASA